MGLAQKVLTLRNLVGQTWRNRTLYHGRADVYRAFLLRMAIGRLGRRLLPQKEVTLHLAGEDEPVYLRRTTSDYQIFMMLFEQGEYDIVRRLELPSEPVIFDLGGNIGLATRRMSQFFPAGRFLAVEPDAANRQMLARNNQDLINRGHLKVMDGFVAVEDGQAAIDRSDGVASMFRMRPAVEGDSEIYACRSVPTLMAEAGVDAIDVLKVDIEGAEAQLFGNCAPWIGRVRHVIVECDPPYSPEALIADLARQGWPCRVIPHAHSVACLARV